MNRIIKERIDELHELLAELPVAVAENGWGNHSLEVLGRIQCLVTVLDDENEDAEEVFEEIAEGISAHGEYPLILPEEEDALPKRRTEPSHKFGAVGVYIVRDGKLLSGTRISQSGFNKICGPGGFVEEGETAEQAAKREAKEEFGVVPMELIPFGKGAKGGDGFEPDLFLCLDFDGEPKCDEVEMTAPRFVSIEKLESDAGKLFEPFADGIQKLRIAVTSDCDTIGKNQPKGSH